MPTLQDYLGVSRMGDQNSRIKGSLDQLPSKNYNLVSICSKISKSSGFLCLYYGFWLPFLAWCTLFVANKKRRKISCLKSLIDRSTFFPRNWSVGGRGEEEIGSPNQKKNIWGGLHWQIQLGGGGGGRGYRSGKKSQDLRSPEIGISEYGYYQLNW